MNTQQISVLKAGVQGLLVQKQPPGRTFSTSNRKGSGSYRSGIRIWSAHRRCATQDSWRPSPTTPTHPSSSTFWRSKACISSLSTLGERCQTLPRIHALPKDNIDGWDSSYSDDIQSQSEDQKVSLPIGETSSGYNVAEYWKEFANAVKGTWKGYSAEFSSKGEVLGRCLASEVDAVVDEHVQQLGIVNIKVSRSEDQEQETASVVLKERQFEDKTILKTGSYSEGHLEGYGTVRELPDVFNPLNPSDFPDGIRVEHCIACPPCQEGVVDRVRIVQHIIQREENMSQWKMKKIEMYRETRGVNGGMSPFDNSEPLTLGALGRGGKEGWRSGEGLSFTSQGRQLMLECDGQVNEGRSPWQSEAALCASSTTDSSASYLSSSPSSSSSGYYELVGLPLGVWVYLGENSEGLLRVEAGWMPSPDVRHVVGRTYAEGFLDQVMLGSEFKC